MTDQPLILISDNDPVARSFLASALRREGFDTVLATSGREALVRLAEHPVEVMLLAVKTCVAEDLATLREIRASDRFRTLPVILITPSDAAEDQLRGLDSGADDYVAKPIAVEELAARVRAQLRGRSAWGQELERARARRRNLAAALQELATDVPLLTLAANLVTRLPKVLEVDGVTILHFAREGVRTIASSGALRRRYPATAALSDGVGREVASRAASGPWLEEGSASSSRRLKALDLAFVPFRLGPTDDALGCLVYGLQPAAPSAPLSHRLPDLIDATDFIVAVLRPAVERAESADAATNRIRQIIAGREFSIHLQPIIRLDTGATVAVEALTRFADGSPPERVFAEAAALGLGLALQRATVAAALAAAERLSPEVSLSVNLSADVVQHEPALGELFGGTPRSIMVELTEHERIDDYPAVRSALKRLGPNVTLAIDDAGSGFASLRHILALKPAYVKLDIEWVHGIARDPVRRALVSGLVYFASETGCELIAEGIETDEELAALRDLGIQLGQGFFLARPAPGRGST